MKMKVWRIVWKQEGIQICGGKEFLCCRFKGKVNEKEKEESKELIFGKIDVIFLLRVKQFFIGVWQEM